MPKRQWNFLESVRNLVNVDRTRTPTHDKDAHRMTFASKDSFYAEETSLEAGARDRPSSRRRCSHGRLRSKTFKILLATPMLALTVLYVHTFLPLRWLH